MLDMKDVMVDKEETVFTIRQFSGKKRRLSLKKIYVIK